MKAVRIYAYGGPKELTYEEVPEPAVGKDEVLVEVRAVGVNPADFKFRNGMFASAFAMAMPLILGMDVAGEVLTVGDEVQGLTIGDRVSALVPHTRMGGYAERIAAPAALFARIPDGLGFAEAASLPTPGLTGWQLVEWGLAVETGMQLLVLGAAGAVGRFACYAGKQRGAHVTAGVRRSRVEAVQWADDVLVLDEDNIVPQAFDLIADTIGGSRANASLDALRPGGVLCSVSTDPVGDTRGLTVTSRRYSVRPDRQILSRLAFAVAAGELSQQPLTVLALRDAALAHERIEAGFGGKLVLAP